MRKRNEYIPGVPVRFSYTTYFDALNYYNDELSSLLNSDNVYDVAEDPRLTFTNDPWASFEEWSYYEDLLHERLSYEEYAFLSETFKGNIFDIDSKHTASIRFLKKQLCRFRSSSDE